MFLVIIVIQNTLEKLYLTNVHMKQNSQSVSPLSILVQRSLVSYHRTNDTPQYSLVRSCKGTKEQRPKGSNLMLSNDFRQPNFNGFLPIFAFFSIFKGINRPEESGIKFPGFPRMCGNTVKSKILRVC